MQPQSRAPVLAVLHDADFRTIWCVGGLSEVARWMEHLVLSWLIWQVTRSPLPLALVLVFNNLPRPLCSPFAGLLADRLSRRRILIGAQLLNTARRWPCWPCSCLSACSRGRSLSPSPCKAW